MANPGGVVANDEAGRVGDGRGSAGPAVTAPADGTGPPPDVPDEGGSARTLTGRLGVWSIVFMVVAAASPLTVMAGVVPLGIGTGNGAAFPATFVICCVILVLFAVGFCAMARQVPRAGAFFTYIRAGFGRPMGMGAAFLALATYTAVQLGVYGYFGAVVQGLVESLGGPSVPWWVYSLIVLAIVAFLGYRHIELSGKVLAVLLICEVGIVLVLDVVVNARGGAAGLSTALLSPYEIGSGALGIALMFAIGSFLGFEATAVYRDEAKDPDRTIPRATYLALLLVGGFYAISAWSVVTAWGEGEAVARATSAPGDMLTATVSRYLGTVGTDVVQVLLVTSIFAAILSFHNVSTRYVFSLANGGALPAAGGRSHARHGSPHVASLTQSGLGLVLLLLFVVVGMDPVTQIFAWLVGTASLGILILMSLTSLAVIVFFRRTGSDRRWWHTAIAPGLGFVGLMICLVLTIANFSLLIGGSGGLAAIIEAILVVVFAAGVVLAVVRRRQLRD